MTDLPQSTVEAVREALHEAHVGKVGIPPIDTLARVALQAALDEGRVVLASDACNAIQTLEAIDAASTVYAIQDIVVRWRRRRERAQ